MKRLFLPAFFRRLFQHKPAKHSGNGHRERQPLHPVFTKRIWLSTPILLALLGVYGTTQQVVQPEEGPSIPVSGTGLRDVPAPPRAEWSKTSSKQPGSVEQALPQIGGIVSVGLNVEISRLNPAGSAGSNSSFIPPDTMAAVGPNHIVEMINGNFEIINKTTGASIQTMTLDQFWTNIVGIASINSGRFDPRIIYDPPSGRWFALGIDRAIDNVPAGGDGTNEVANNFFLARSDTSDPTGDWDGVTFSADSTGALEFHDYPTLGVDADGFYSCTQDFNGGGNESCYSIPKADLLLAAPTAANLTRFEATPAGLPAVDGSWQPAVNRGLSIGRVPVLGTTGGRCGERTSSERPPRALRWEPLWLSPAIRAMQIRRPPVSRMTVIREMVLSSWRTLLRASSVT